MEFYNALFIAWIGSTVAIPPSIPKHHQRTGSSLELIDNRPFDVKDITSNDIAALDASKRDSCTCGARNEEDRIVGGRPAAVGEFPWRCGLFYNDPSEGMRLFCGCSIISREYVMTAAHCTNALPNKQLYVDIGDYDITRKEEIENQVLKAVKVIQHESYDKIKHDWDMSLLKLERSIKFTRNISPVCLPWKFVGHSFDNATAVASGSGTTEEGGKISPVLRTVDLPVLTAEQCRLYYAEGKISDNMICTYSPGKDTCQGDSGSSIDYKDEATGQYYAIGVVSWGTGCAREGKPGVYAKVTNFLNWIESHAEGASFCKP